MKTKRVIKERKCFRYEEFRHIVKNYKRRKEEKVKMQQSPNKFEVLVSRVIKAMGKEKKDKKIILKKERLKKEKKKKLVKVRKTQKVL